MKSIDLNLPNPPQNGKNDDSNISRKSFKKHIELLSPARNIECGIAAIEHGADAVYIGASRFGARVAAGNSTEDIQKLCNYAHRFGVKVYVAINTLLNLDEREQARLLAWDVYYAGADALIVQDKIFLDMVMPPIPLHASTQMDNRTVEDALRLKDLGYKQIVLARELSLEQIKKIYNAIPDLPLEAFVHGALCVSYSGRCYASEYCFDRSANRGECAQFCRLPFSLEDASGNMLIKNKYLLSLRDMNRINRLEEMMDAGVRSFKIEGRLKDISYVKNVTASYRQALDDIMHRRTEYIRSSFGKSSYTFQPDLTRSFSRGNTEYFLSDRTNDLAEPDTPKSKGREVGHVKEVRRDCIIVSSTEKFNNGDGICFFDEKGHLQGFRINKAINNQLFFNPTSSEIKIKKGDCIWRSFDKQWEDLMSKKTAERRIAAQFKLEEEEQGFRLVFTAEDGTNRSEMFVKEHLLAHIDQTSSIKEVLCKLGDTPYFCERVDIRFSQPWFIPRSTIAEWRRKLVVSSPHTIRELSNCVSTSKHLHTLRNDTLAANYHDSFKKTPQKTGEHKGNTLMTCRFCLRHAWGQCHNDNSSSQTTKAKWQDPLFLVLGDGRRFRLEFNCKRCEMKVLST